MSDTADSPDMPYAGPDRHSFQAEHPKALLREYRKQLRIFRKAAEKMNSSQSVQEVLRALVAAGMELCNATRGACGLMVEGEMVISERNDNGTIRPVHFVRKPGHGTIGQLILTRRTYVSNDAQNDENITIESRRELGFYNLIDVPIIYRDGKLLGCLLVNDKRDRVPFDHRDVTLLEQLASMAAVAAENARLWELQKEAEAEAALMARFPDENPYPVLRVSADGEVLYANKASEIIEEAWACRKGQKLTGGALQMVVSALESRRRGEIELRCGDRTFSLTFAPIAEADYVNIYGLDVTRRKQAQSQRRRLEARILESQKLESLGVLAGGIAHDFNNLLVAILGNADLALQTLSPASPAKGNVEEIKKASIRASDLTNQMLAYSGKGHFVIEKLDLNTLVREMGELLKVSISKTATVRYELANEPAVIEADATQIRQVMMNLITNASEAIGEAEGTITIRTDVIDADSAYLAQSYLDEQLPEGRYACLEVSDTGCGMDPATKAKLFDPFFSTKFAGRGLGLSAVQGIVRGHHGGIRVYSEPDQGTRFKILLPSKEPAGKEVVPPRPAGEESWKGQGTILVADDEETVRNVARAMMERSGFTVLLASDGHKAIEVFSEHSDEIEAVLLDMTMPGPASNEVVRRLHGINPSVPVVLCSGYNQQDATARFGVGGLAGFIQKPFQLHALMSVLGRAIAEADPRS